jgi:hypothetical protein
VSPHLSHNLLKQTNTFVSFVSKAIGGHSEPTYIKACEDAKLADTFRRATHPRLERSITEIANGSLACSGQNIEGSQWVIIFTNDWIGYAITQTLYHSLVDSFISPNLLRTPRI